MTAADAGEAAGAGSELERAIQEATVGRPAVQPAALWSEAAAELRGRRGGEASVARAPATNEAHGPVAVAVARRPARRPAKARSAPRTTVATRVALVVLGVSVITLAMALTWRFVGSSSSPTAAGPRRGSASASHSPPPSPPLPATPSPSPSPSPLAPLAPPQPSALAPTTEVEATPGPPSTIASAAEAPADGADAPPAVRQPLDHGLLRVDTDDAVDVYLQGVRVGEAGRWLEVPCGVRNARLARRGSPPPGHSFPMWMGTGRTVHVPCGAAHAVKWTWE